MGEAGGTHSVRQLPQNEWLFEQKYGLALMVDGEITWYEPSSLSVLVVLSGHFKA
jgi:hypothetical protein